MPQAPTVSKAALKLFIAVGVPQPFPSIRITCAVKNKTHKSISWKLGFTGFETRLQNLILSKCSALTYRPGKLKNAPDNKGTLQRSSQFLLMKQSQELILL
jgi:hypothetical protein